jgi:hypothetical protein
VRGSHWNTFQIVNVGGSGLWGDPNGNGAIDQRNMDRFLRAAGLEEPQNR